MWVFKGLVLVPDQPDECQIPGLNSVYSEAHMLLSSLGSTGIRSHCPCRDSVSAPWQARNAATCPAGTSAHQSSHCHCLSHPWPKDTKGSKDRMAPTCPGDAPWAAVPWAGPCGHASAQEISFLILSDPPVNHRVYEPACKAMSHGKSSWARAECGSGIGAHLKRPLGADEWWQEARGTPWSPPTGPAISPRCSGGIKRNED